MSWSMMMLVIILQASTNKGVLDCFMSFGVLTGLNHQSRQYENMKSTTTRLHTMESSFCTMGGMI